MSKLISYNNLTMVACSLFYFLHNIFLLNLLVHNSQRIKSKDFYYIVINVFWQIYVYTHITITPIKMWNVFITPKIPHASFQAISCTLNPNSHWSDFYYYSLVLTILKLQINEIIQYIFFCVWILSLKNIILSENYEFWTKLWIMNKIHSSCCLHQYFVNSYCQVMCHCTTMCLLILLMIDIWVLSIFKNCYN